MKVLVFTPTYEVRGVEQMRPETRASIEALRVPEGVELRWVIGRENPFPYPTHKNVLAQYQRAREMALAEGYDALWTVEHDMVVPPDAVGKLAGREYGDLRADVVYGVYVLRHGAYVLNAWEYIGERNLGSSLSIRPRSMKRAREQGWIRVSGVAWGCTWIGREVLEQVEFTDGGGDNPAGDLAFAHACLAAGMVSVARFDVLCGHYEDGRWLWPFQEVEEMAKVLPLQNVVIPGGVQLVKGQEAEIDPRLIQDLVRAGYVKRLSRDEEPEPETAALEAAPEKAVKSKGRRRKTADGGL